MMKFLTTSLFTLAIVALASTGFAADKPKAVRFYADWCGSCRVLDAKLSPLKPEFADQIDFVVFDLTNDTTRTAAAEKANELNLTRIFEAYGNGTGRLVLTDAAGDELGMLTREASVEQLRLELEQLSQLASDIPATTNAYSY